MILETEFKEGPPPLPSPPPTPPTAPALQLLEDVPYMDDSLPYAGSTFDRWKIRLKKDLEMVSNDDLSNDYFTEEDSTEVNIGWKSFEEERQELLQQLEKVKMK